MVIVFLLVFAAATLALAIGGAKLSKKAREMKIKQDLELYQNLKK
jgi:hypothetical protein